MTQQTPSREDIIEDIKKIADQEGEPLTLKEYLEHGEYGLSYFMGYKFDRWNEAKEEAGLELIRPEIAKGEEHSNYYTDEEIFAELRKVWMKTGKVIQQRHIQEHGDISPQTINYRFGSIKKAKKLAGIEDRHELFKQWERELENEYGRFTTKELKEMLPQYNSHFFRDFVDWVNERDKIQIRKPKPNSQRGVKQVFIRQKDKDFKEVMLDKFGDDIPEGKEDIFMELMGQGLKPQGIIAALHYLEDDVKQEDVADEYGVTPITVRHNRDKIVQAGFEDRFDEIKTRKSVEEIKNDE